MCVTHIDIWYCEKNFYDTRSVQAVANLTSLDISFQRAGTSFCLCYMRVHTRRRKIHSLSIFPWETDISYYINAVHSFLLSDAGCFLTSEGFCAF